MGHSAAESFSGNLFAGYGFNYCRSCQEHLRGAFYHVDEVGQCRRIYGAACRRSHNCGNLRNNAGCNGIAPENLAIAGKSIYCFLDTGSAGIIQAYARSTDFKSQFVYVNNFRSVHFTKGAAFYREVLGKCEYESSVYSTITGNDTFAGEIFLLLAEVVAARLNKRIDFYKRAFIKQKSKSFAGCQFAFCMLFFNFLFPTHSLYVCEVIVKKFNSFCNSCHSYTSKNIGPLPGRPYYSIGTDPYAIRKTGRRGVRSVPAEGR